MKNKTGYTMKQLRDIAHGACRSMVKSMGYDVWQKDGKQALAILEDNCRMPINHNKLYRTWYTLASENQLDMFVREWNSEVKRLRQVYQAFGAK